MFQSSIFQSTLMTLQNGKIIFENFSLFSISLWFICALIKIEMSNFVYIYNFWGPLSAKRWFSEWCLSVVFTDSTRGPILSKLDISGHSFPYCFNNGFDKIYSSVFFKGSNQTYCLPSLKKYRFVSYQWTKIGLLNRRSSSNINVSENYWTKPELK